MKLDPNDWINLPQAVVNHLAQDPDPSISGPAQSELSKRLSAPGITTLMRTVIDSVILEAEVEAHSLDEARSLLRKEIHRHESGLKTVPLRTFDPKVVKLTFLVQPAARIDVEPMDTEPVPAAPDWTIPIEIGS